MRFVDEYRDPAAARRPGRPHHRAGRRRPLQVHGGVRRAHPHDLPPRHRARPARRTSSWCTGPGCPVCVIPMGRVDDAIAVAETPGVIFTSFGDMMRVPGGHGNLLGGQGAGRRRALRLLAARRAAASPVENPGPGGRVLRRRVRDHGAVDRASRCCGPASWASPTSRCSATTSRSCRRSRRSSSRPTCASTASSARATCRPSSATGPTASCPSSTASRWSPPGFEPLDILQAIAMLLAQIREGRCEVENQYTRVVRDEGNPRALAGARRGVRAAPALRVAGPRLHLAERAEAAPRVRRLRRRAALRGARASGWPTPRPASAARC